MKHSISIKIATLMMGGVMAAAVSSCEDAEYTALGKGVFLSEAYNSASKKVVLDDAKPSVVTATVRAANITNKDIKATIGAQKKSLEQFNEKNGTNYEMVPAELYSFESNEVTIAAGTVSASVIGITIKPLSAEMLASGKKYALPISITNADETIVQGFNTIIYTLDPVIVTSAPVFTGSKSLKLNMGESRTVTQWSIEMRINMSNLGNGQVNNYNNQALFSSWPPKGDAADGEIYIRFGDAPIPGNILQVKTQGSQINCQTKFNANQWYHLAFVCNGTTLTIYVDGNVDVVMNLPNKPLLLAETFTICDSGSWFKAHCIMSELRFWTSAITQSQIQNNMFAIDPATAGLEGYWKLNDGPYYQKDKDGNLVLGKDGNPIYVDKDGNPMTLNDRHTFKDATGHGHDGYADRGIVRWEEGIRSDGKTK